MGLLTNDFLDTVTVGGCTFKTAVSFDAVLIAQKLFKDERLNSREKIHTALGMFIKSRFRVFCLSEEQKGELLQAVYDSQVKIKEHPRVSAKQQRILDFDLDGEYIYASFMQAYGIDLIDMQGKLHWKKFFALFEGLPDDTKIKQIMQIRGMDIPCPTKYNQKEIQNITELKSYYALPVVGGGGQKGLDQLFSTLERMAEW